MRKLKIFICCPGSWSNGLNSPERGEGRWAQNWAKLLGKMGHEVTAWSAGPGSNGVVEGGVRRIGMGEIITDGPYDIYIDPTWWAGKTPLVEACFYFRCYWALEQQLREPGLPSNHCIIYPYQNTAHLTFLSDANPYRDRTFHMPSPLRASMAAPAFDRLDVLFPTHASPSECLIPQNAKLATDKVYSYIDNGANFNCHWLYGENIKHLDYVEAARSHPGNTTFYAKMPYDQVVNIIDMCRLTVQFNSCSCAVDSVVAGVPFVAWEYGGFFTEVAKELGICIERGNETKARVEEVIDTLFTSREVYEEYVCGLQSLLHGHTEDVASDMFNEILDTMGI